MITLSCYQAFIVINLVLLLQAPGPEPKWKETFEAINENVKCHQRIGDNAVIGREDCLVLNIYTPLNSYFDDRLAVMFFIHGGGYYQGSGSKFFYGPEFLAPKGVILVAINYRLNIQGFLCLGIKEAPGNAGMKDQVAALRWVQRNIKSFGGDPDNITIFGESAGGASVSFHVISPMSKGLFSKAIIQSGSSLSSWTLQYRPVYMASLLAKALGHPKVSEPYDIYNTFMSKSDIELIITRVPRKEGNLIISEVLYVPCVERKIDGIEPFLTELPYDIFEKGDFNKIPLMIGVNGEEGYFFVALENSTVIPKISFEKSLPKDLIIPSTKETKAVAEKLNTIYMGEDNITQETLLKLSKYVGDVNFYYPSFTETELILRSTDKPVYNYLFDYDGWRNIPKLTLAKQFKFAPGATHADELFYLFNLCVLPSQLFENKMIERLTTLWTNFVKFG